MNRKDAVSLLKEIMAACPSFYTAQMVSIAKDKEKDSWMLSVKWVPDSFDKECLSAITLKHSLEVTTTNGRMFFRSSTKLL